MDEEIKEQGATINLDDIYDIQEIERRLREERPPTFVDATRTETWHLPHDPEQWVKVRRLTAFEIREYQAISARTSAYISNPDRWDMEMRAADSYLYLLTRGIVEYQFKDETGRLITGRQQMRGHEVLNEETLKRVYVRLDPLVASWLERKLLVFNDLTPPRRERARRREEQQ